VAALAASRWTNWCLSSCCVPMIDVLDAAPVNWLGSDPLSPGWGGCMSMICWCGIGEEGDSGKTCEVLRTLSLASCGNGLSSNQHARYTQDESCWVWVQVAGVSHHFVICNKSVWCCLFVCRDTLWCTTAEITWLSDINCTLFKGKDLGWWLSQIIPRILHETDANNHITLYR